MEYLKEIDIIDANENEKISQLIKTILKTQKDLSKAHINFEFAEDELIDFYTYQIKALQSKLNYLIKIAKLKNIDFDVSIKKVV